MYVWLWGVGTLYMYTHIALKSSSKRLALSSATKLWTLQQRKTAVCATQ